MRDANGTSARKIAFCTVATPRIARIWTKPDPPDPGAPFEMGIVGGGFDSGSVTAVLANSACVKNQCAAVSLASRSFDYLAGSAPAVPGGHYAVAVKNAADTQFAERDLMVPPKLDQLSTVPPVPVRNVPFQYSLAGKGFWVGQIRIRIFHPTLCPKGCDPGANIFPQSTSTRLQGRMWLASPGTFEVEVESAGAISNRVKVEVK